MCKNHIKLTLRNITFFKKIYIPKNQIKKNTKSINLHKVEKIK